MDAAELRGLLEKSGKSQSELARHLNLHPSQVNKMVRGNRKIVSTEADKILAYFALHAGGISGDARKGVQLREAGLTMADIHQWSNDVPVYGNAMGGTSAGADVILNGDTGMRVRRPPRLEGRVDILALFVQGDSMVPRYLPGELIYLERARPPHIGDYVVVEMKPGPDGEQPAYLKQLIGRSATKLKLQQHNPEKVIEIELAKVLQVIRVMTMQDLMGP